MEQTSSNSYIAVKQPASRLLESQGRYFIAYAPSASIIPIDEELASCLLNKGREEEIKRIAQLEQLINLGAVELTDKPRRNSLTHCIEPPIKTLIFHITQGCNLRCRHCYIEASGTNVTELSGKTICDTITTFADMGGLVIDITGGEPLLRGDVFDILNTSKSKGLHTNLLSNGINISRGIAKKIKENVSRITISLDGLGETHDWIRGAGVFDKVKASIDYLVAEETPLGTTTMFTYRNLEQLEDIQSFLIGRGVKFWSLVLPRKVGRFKEDDISNKTCEEWFSNIRKYYDVLRRIQERARNATMEVVIDHVMIPYEDRKEMRIDPQSLIYSLYTKGRICWDNTITIMPNGDVKGCLFIDGFVYGNLKKGGIRDIYSSNRRRETIEQFKEMKGESECPIIPLCDSI